jgi:hypothetical protein
MDISLPLDKMSSLDKIAVMEKLWDDLSQRFPFAVYYRLQKDIIRVYAILDCRRNPAWIRNRLT